MRKVVVDYFKGAAILLIILVHSAQPFGLKGLLGDFACFGQMGCQIFFLMSSYCLIYSFNHSSRVVSFYKKRIFRIAPGYWTMIVINFLVMLLSTCLFSKNYFLTSTNCVDYLINIFFLNGLTPGTANNQVVLGGWYVGTSILLYALFPCLYKIYFSIKHHKRHIYVPLLLFIITTGITKIIQFYTGIECTNNSFLYFSFINQLPVFILGFSLYDIVEKKLIIRLPFIKSIIFLLLAVLFFYHSEYQSFILCPVVFALSMLYLYVFFSARNIVEGRGCNLLKKFSLTSYPIYLTHTIVVYYFMGLVITILRHYNLFNFPTLIYCVSLPVIFLLVYIVGRLFNLYLNKIDKVFSCFRGKSSIEKG